MKPQSDSREGGAARICGRRRAQFSRRRRGPRCSVLWTDPSGPTAWKTIPSWDLGGTIDNAIPSSIQLFMANRAHAHITEVKAGHVSMISQPDGVTTVIEEAVQ